MALDPSSILLTDRVAVVTGGGAGIGRGIAAGFTAFGAKVAIWERNPETCAAAAEEIGALGIPPTSATAPRSTPHSPDRGRTRAVTILVNNAGGVFWSGDPRHQRERLGRALQVQSAPRLPVHPAGGRGMVEQGWRAASSASRRSKASAPHRVTRHTRRPRPASSTTPRPRRSNWRRIGIRVQRAGPRHHLDRRHHADRPPGSEERFGLTVRWDAPATSTRWPAQQCFSRPTCPATSPVRRSTSTAAPTPPAAGTTIRRPGAYALGPT